MAYIPSTSFSLNVGAYTPSLSFNFSGSLTANISGDLSGAVASFSADLNNPLQATISESLNNVSASFSAETPLPDVPYSPGADFTFNNVGYAPDSNFTFINADHWTRVNIQLDGVSVSFSGSFKDPTLYEIRSHYTPKPIKSLFAFGNVYGAYASEMLNDLSADFSVTYFTKFEFDNYTYVPDPTYSRHRFGEGTEGSFNNVLDDIGSDFLSTIFDEQRFIARFDNPLDDVNPIFSGNNEVTASFDNLLDSTVAEFYTGNADFGSIFRASLDDTVAFFNGEYDPNVLRLTIGRVESSINNAQKENVDKVCFALEQATFQSINVISIEVGTTKAANESCMSVDNGTPINVKTVSVQEDAESLDSKTCFITENGTPIHDEFNSVVEKATGTDNKFCSVKQQMTKVYPERWESVKQDSSKNVHDSIEVVDVAPVSARYIPFPIGRTFEFGTQYETVNYEIIQSPNPVLVHFRQSIEKGRLTSSIHGDWSNAEFVEVKKCSFIEKTKKPDPGVSPWIDDPRDPVDPEPPTGNTHTVPVQEVYTMQNIITVTLDDDLTEIHVNDVSLSLDADSFAWQFTATLLDESQRTLVTQNTDGSAKKLHITINGYTWHVLVETIKTTRRFNENSISISGRGLTGLLGKPYVEESSVNFGSLLGVNQIADQILPNGWTINWSMPTWNVDAEAYSYQNMTSIDALMDIGKNIGAVIVPARDSQEIEFKPRYPILPWNFDSVAVDVAISDSAIIELTEEPTSSYQANGVYLHGNEIGGELAFVRLNGTAGDRLATTENNSLMTDVVGLRAFGERILAGEYKQPEIRSFKTFMDGTLVPLINIGDYIGVTVGGVETNGIANSISINANHVEVTQQITIGERTQNSWVMFNELLPKDPMLVTTLSNTDGTTSLMTLIDGGVVRVRGTGTVGNKYYIRSGEIISEAPNLAQSEIVL